VLERDIDAAAADVQSAISRTLRRLPPELTDPPSYKKVNPADAPILILALTSDITPLQKVDDFAENVVSPALSTVDGVAQVLVFGSQKYAVRIQVDPSALAARGIGINDMQTAIANANTNTPVGTLKNKTQALTIDAKTSLADAKQFNSIIVAAPNGKPIRLGDIANVKDGVENDQTASSYNGKRAILLAVFRQPEANTVEVVDRVKKMLPQFDAELPTNTQLHVLNDRSKSIRESVSDVQFTLGLVLALVILVIFLFLRKVSATVIPALAVPISLIATLAAMYVLNFSIDNISLLGLTLAVGLVVDDAIVMLENIYRHMEEDHIGAFEAALRGSREIGFTIISITVALIAVFIPVLLMGGVVGRIFNEFAVVVTVSIMASAFVSLTLTPMLASKMLRADPPGHQLHGWAAVFERSFSSVTRGYAHGLDFCLRYRPFMLIVFFATMVAPVYLVITTPKGFFPQEDIGQISVSTEARGDISFEAMEALQKKVEDVFIKSPYIENVANIVGTSGTSQTLNQGRFFVELKSQDERPDLQTVLRDLRRQLSGIPGITTYLNPVQNLKIGGRTTRAQYQYVLQDLDTTRLYDWAGKITDAMSKDSTFVDVNNDLEINATQVTLDVDKDKAAALGITADQLRNSLYSGFGERQVSTIYTTVDSYEVILEFDPRLNWTMGDVPDIRIRNIAGKLVPIGAFSKVVRRTGSLAINQLGQLPAVTVSFNLPAGVSLGEAVDHINEIKNELRVPASITSSFSGTAKTFQDSLANQNLLLMAAIITIYIFLGILYESFIHPFTILTGLPSAVVGALLALRLFGLDLSVIAVIGLLMLIGIVKKNAIMMIDVALTMQREGRDPQDAIRTAALVRFRPIMMTTLTAILGTLPIAVAFGAGAELRQPLGVAVVGGLLVSQALTLYITPVLYLYMEDISRMLSPRKKQQQVLPAPTPAE
jgi:HAE1 family hydrophobic/amphiphilic exporter-1